MTIDGELSPVDYIFGELDQPQNAAQWLKKRLSGVHHYSQKTPHAPVQDKPLVINVTTDMGQVYDEIFIWFTTDEWQHTRKTSFTKHRLVWNSITWSYIQEWQVTLPPQSEGVMLRYKIGAKIPGFEEMVYTDNQSRSFGEATHYSIWYGKENNPAWAKHAIVYQVFVDRFNPGNGNTWTQTSDIRKHYGGTLAGVIERLAFIKDMGFNAIWLSPIFDSPSHHGYDTADYFQINPRLGTLEDFKLLIAKAHRLEIRVILDFVANHCSDNHPFFEDALQNSNSAYHDWFVWKKWPEYERFFNVGSMPKLNLSFGSPAKDHLLEAARYWLEMGVDGYRLDYAYGPEHDFWVDFRRVCSSVNPNVWTFGELVLPADIQACYADALGGSLDFLLAQAVRATFGSQTWKLSKFAGFINSHFQYFPENHSLPGFFDNHDMDRFYTVAEDDKQRLKLALLMLYVLPGPPIIYYGTEVPLSQKHLLHEGGGLGFDEARLEMDWQNAAQSDIPRYLRKLADVRCKLGLSTNNKWHLHTVDDAQQIMVLAAQDKNLLLFVNRSKENQTVSLHLDKEIGEHQDVLTLVSYHFTDHRLEITLPPISGLILSSC
jgi:glycosidase